MTFCCCVLLFRFVVGIFRFVLVMFRFVLVVFRFGIQVATQLSTPDLQDLCYIYMVGGFCASPLLQDAIREEFDDPGRDLKVVVAPRPGLAVVSASWRAANICP